MTKPRVSEAVAREAARGNKMLRDRSNELYAQWGKIGMFPSTMPGDRGAVSPLDGRAKPAAEQSKTRSR